MSNHKFLSFVSLAFSLGSFSVYADVNPFKAAIDHYSQECGKELGIAPEKVKVFVWDVNADYDPCFLKCFFEKPGVIRNGIFDKDQSLAFYKLYIQNEDELAQLAAVDENCKKVNDIDVGDKDTGCKRAALLYKCISEHAI